MRYKATAHCQYKGSKVLFWMNHLTLSSPSSPVLVSPLAFLLSSIFFWYRHRKPLALWCLAASIMQSSNSQTVSSIGFYSFHTTFQDSVFPNEEPGPAQFSNTKNSKVAKISLREQRLRSMWLGLGTRTMIVTIWLFRLIPLPPTLWYSRSHIYQSLQTRLTPSVWILNSCKMDLFYYK